MIFALLLIIFVFIEYLSETNSQAIYYSASVTISRSVNYLATYYFIGINFRGYNFWRSREFFGVRESLYSRNRLFSVAREILYPRNLTFEVTREILIKNTKKIVKIRMKISKFSRNFPRS